MKPAIIIGIVVVVIIIAVASYFAFRSDAPAPSPDVDAPAEIGDGINDVIDSQIDEIANDIANAAKEGYISRREYYTSESKLRDLTEIVMKNIAGKPIKAIVSRDDVSGVLKVLMTGVDPNVFQPSASAISDCVSGKIKTSTTGPRDIPMYVYDCTDDYFSENSSDFDKVAPAALTMYENAFNQYASEERKQMAKEMGGFKKGFSCSLANGGDKEASESCINGSEIPKITWENVKPFIARFNPPTGPTPTAVRPDN